MFSTYYRTRYLKRWSSFATVGNFYLKRARCRKPLTVAWIGPFLLPGSLLEEKMHHFYCDFTIFNMITEALSADKRHTKNIFVRKLIVSEILSSYSTNELQSHPFYVRETAGFCSEQHRIVSTVRVSSTFEQHLLYILPRSHYYVQHFHSMTIFVGDSACLVLVYVLSLS